MIKTLIIRHIVTLLLLGFGSSALAKQVQSNVAVNQLQPFLGVNFNESLELLSSEDLQRSQTQWARGFIPYELYATGKRDLKNDDRIESFKQLKKLGYKTILSLKYNYHGRDFPSTTVEIKTHLAYTQQILDELYDYTDVIVAGNEPFIESKRDQRGPMLINFYKHIAQTVKNYVDQQAVAKPIFIGAFNRLWEPLMQQQSEALFEFAKNTPWVAGVDLHIHHASDEQFKVMMDFADERLRNGQKIISTEFSLMAYWRQSLNYPIPAILHTQYQRPQDWKVYQYLDYTLNTSAVSHQEWLDFLSNSNWFESRKHYIRESWQRFNQYPKFWGATYGLYQTYGNKPFGQKNDPWILNSLYSTRTVQHDTNNVTPQHYQFLADFIQLQTLAKEVDVK